MKNTNFICIKIFFIALIISVLSNWQSFAKKESKKPRWEEILPEIGKEFLPEDTREKLDKFFPPPQQHSEKENIKNGKIKTYHGDTELSGELSSAVKILGNGKLKHVDTSQSVTIIGKAVIKDSHLVQLVVDGSLQASDTTFQNFKVNGSTHLKDCMVREHSTIGKDLTAKDCKFQGTLQIAGKHARVNNSTVADIKFLASSDKKILILEGSKVRGNITFEGTKGKVILKDSKIHGKIKNGFITSDEES